MLKFVGESKQQLLAKPLPNLKDSAIKKSWVALNQYFDGAGNGPEAKVACVVITAATREMQAVNNAKSLELISSRLKLTKGRGLTELPSSQED